MKPLEKLLKKFEDRLTDAWQQSVDEDRCKGKFTFGKLIVSFKTVGSDKYITVWNPVKDIYLDNIAEWLEENSIGVDEIEREESDVWNLNGFSNEADYINYKYM